MYRRCSYLACWLSRLLASTLRCCSQTLEGTNDGTEDVVGSGGRGSSIRSKVEAAVLSGGG